jgi:uncharacterized protein (DUF952 family)
MLFKITTTTEWQVATETGQFMGSTLDLKDGYIHLSTAAQARETAQLHFAGQEDLVLVAIANEAVAGSLKWEASRGGQLFPHVYATLKAAEIVWVKRLPWNGAAHDFPPEFQS